MALGATIYTFDIELADADRAVYESLNLRVAQHPSETPDYLMTRVLAYCLEFGEGIGFSKRLSDPDEPAIFVRDLTGALQTWVDIGLPEPERLHRASKASPRVAVYTHKDATHVGGAHQGREDPPRRAPGGLRIRARVAGRVSSRGWNAA